MSTPHGRAKRVEVLEGHLLPHSLVKLDIVRVIVNMDFSVASAFRRGKNMELIPVSDEELAEIRRQNEIDTQEGGRGA